LLDLAQLKKAKPGFGKCANYNLLIQFGIVNHEKSILSDALR
jgi:hypothetical protein